jgi:hypothetical protein
MRYLTGAAVVATSVTAWTLLAVADGPKKGGETCKDNDECQTNVCDDGKCDPCPDRNNCPPPGTCTEDDLRTKQEQVDELCKSEDRPNSCPGAFDQKDISCVHLKEMKKNGELCVQARNTVMNDCFKTGNDSHREQRDTVQDNVKHCQEMIDYKTGVGACFSCSDSDYQEYEGKRRDACAKDRICEEEENDEKIDCDKIEEKIKNSQGCIDSVKELVDECFDGKEKTDRQTLREKSESAAEHCKEVLEYKKDKKLCE